MVPPLLSFCSILTKFWHKANRSSLSVCVLVSVYLCRATDPSLKPEQSRCWPKAAYCFFLPAFLPSFFPYIDQLLLYSSFLLLFAISSLSREKFYFRKQAFLNCSVVFFFSFRFFLKEGVLVFLLLLQQTATEINITHNYTSTPPSSTERIAIG